jgi:RNA polymerase sigma-70 factor (ECF subfamily)
MTEERTQNLERALVDRMLDGDEAAFREFCDDYIPPLYRFARWRLSGDIDMAREVVQATVCKAIANLAAFRGEAALSTWLAACCRNEIGALYRRGPRSGREVSLEEDPFRQPVAPASDGPEHSLLRQESAQLVHRTLDELPPRYGRVLEWKYLEDLPVAEIARRLQIGTKAAESLLTRAREAFRRGYARLGSPAVATGSWAASTNGVGSAVER